MTRPTPFCSACSTHSELDTSKSIRAETFLLLSVDFASASSRLALSVFASSLVRVFDIFAHTRDTR